MNKQEYLLTCLLEELSEVQKAVSKALRFGLDDKYEDATNLEMIEYELLDCTVLLDLIEEEGITIESLSKEDYDGLVEAKKQKLNKWMYWGNQNNKTCGKADKTPSYDVSICRFRAIKFFIDSLEESVYKDNFFIHSFIDIIFMILLLFSINDAFVKSLI